MSGCPICSSENVQPLLQADGVPVFCNVQWNTSDEARHAPGARLDIRLCQACGHAHNAAFDPDAVQYTPAYDNSQHFSDTFRRYACRLVDRLVADHALRNAAVVDIGCGRGDLLALFAERHGLRGYGFDPSFAPAQDLPLPADVVIRREYFAREAAAELRPALVCCRHVLEHVVDPLGFLRDIREILAPLGSSVLYLEVPNGDQLIRERAVWDYIYEHVSYFSRRSLATVLASAGFEVLRLEEDFGGQFLCAEVRPSPARTSADAGGSILPELPGAAVVLRAKLQAWRDWAAETTFRSRRATVWGAGSKGVMFANLLGLRAGGPVGFFVDQNPNKEGRYIALSGQVIRSPGYLGTVPVDDVVVMNPIYAHEIGQRLDALNVRTKVVTA